jgi:hypothetical protein
MLSNESFESSPFDFLRMIQGACGAQGSKNPRIKEVEFRVDSGGPSGSLGKHGDPEGQEQVFHDMHIPFNNLPFYLTFPGNVADVEEV